MILKRLLPYVIIFFLMIPSFVFSQMQEVKDYTVKKGDTLWDISGGELEDPFLWPKVWKENPEIENPDRIYPDQIIRIPLYLLQKEMPWEHAPVVEKEPPLAEEAAKIEPRQPSFLVDKNLLMASGYVSETVPGVGEIIGAPTGRKLYGNDDLILVRTAEPVNIGDKFYIIKAREKVRHPVTNKKMGYIIEILGLAEIEEIEFGNTIARITKAFREINVSNLLADYYELSAPLVEEPYRKPDIEGYVVAERSLRLLSTMFDIIYIDKGIRDGIEIGDMLQTVTIVDEKVPYTFEHKQRNGVIQIIGTKDATSTAIVRNSKMPVLPGNLIMQLQ